MLQFLCVCTYRSKDVFFVSAYFISMYIFVSSRLLSTLFVLFQKVQTKLQMIQFTGYNKPNTPKIVFTNFLFILNIRAVSLISGYKLRCICILFCLCITAHKTKASLLWNCWLNHQLTVTLNDGFKSNADEQKNQ